MNETKLIEDRACSNCYEFNESVEVTVLTAGCYEFHCINCGELNIYFGDE